jgi:hypothetical protein
MEGMYAAKVPSLTLPGEMHLHKLRVKKVGVSTASASILTQASLYHILP